MPPVRFALRVWDGWKLDTAVFFLVLGLNVAGVLPEPASTIALFAVLLPSCFARKYLI